MNKTETIIAYIINYFQCSDSPKNLGKVKLVKILWFADREFMHKYYTGLTDLEYIKMPNGPMPSNIDSILTSMQDKGIIKSFKVSKFDYIQQSYLCLQEPNLDDLTSKEVSVLDRVIIELQDKNATELSNQTHDELWESMYIGEVMPVESVFLQDIIPATKDDING